MNTDSENNISVKQQDELNFFLTEIAMEAMGYKLFDVFGKCQTSVYPLIASASLRDRTTNDRDSDLAKHLGIEKEFEENVETTNKYSYLSSTIPMTSMVNTRRNTIVNIGSNDNPYGGGGGMAAASAAAATATTAATDNDDDDDDVIQIIDEDISIIHSTSGSQSNTIISNGGSNTHNDDDDLSIITTTTTTPTTRTTPTKTPVAVTFAKPKIPTSSYSLSVNSLLTTAPTTTTTQTTQSLTKPEKIKRRRTTVSAATYENLTSSTNSNTPISWPSRRKLCLDNMPHIVQHFEHELKNIKEDNERRRKTYCTDNFPRIDREFEDIHAIIREFDNIEKQSIDDECATLYDFIESLKTDEIHKNKIEHIYNTILNRLNE